MFFTDWFQRFEMDLDFQNIFVEEESLIFWYLIISVYWSEVVKPWPGLAWLVQKYLPGAQLTPALPPPIPRLTGPRGQQTWVKRNRAGCEGSQSWSWWRRRRRRRWCSYKHHTNTLTDSLALLWLRLWLRLSPGRDFRPGYFIMLMEGSWWRWWCWVPFSINQSLK